MCRFIYVCIYNIYLLYVCMFISVSRSKYIYLLGGVSGKEPAFQCGRHKRHGFNPWVRKIPWRKEWQPTPVFLPGESMDRGTWQAAVHGFTQSQTWLKQLSINIYIYIYTPTNTYIHIIFRFISLKISLENKVSSSLCYTVGPCWLSILYMSNVCMLIPNFWLVPSPSQFFLFFSDDGCGVVVLGPLTANECAPSPPQGLSTCPGSLLTQNMDYLISLSPGLDFNHNSSIKSHWKSCYRKKWTCR